MPYSRAKQPIRVCYLIDRLVAGGTELQLLNLIAHLDRQRVQPFLCLLDGNSAESRSLEPANCRVVRLGVQSLHSASTLVKGVRFASFLAKNKIDVLQTYFPDSSYFGIPLARFLGIRNVVRTRFNLGYWVTPLHRLLGRLCNLFAKATITNCVACRDALLADERPDRSSVVVLENGIDPAPFAAIPDLEISTAKDRPVRIGLVANLRPVKDPASFVRAAQQLISTKHNVEFFIAGDGAMREELAQLIQSLNLTRHVTLCGKTTDIPGFLSRIDLAVLCSRSEGLSNAILEYMAAGRAIVATAVGGTPQLIEHNVHGLLVEPNKPELLAEAISRLLRNPAFAETLAKAARRRAYSLYTHEARARRYERFYRQLVSEGTPPKPRPIGDNRSAGVKHRQQAALLKAC